ncbi:tRNA guanosine(34) transglycosylase Tgt [Candidatus Woesearchaeota archaeon]|nr:tRNA guanosine(34) transglycosylase Tgt [Candidatus Woesearchaeota archaeon]
MTHFTITHQDGNARIGQLQTAHGLIETPFFMPAATKATGKIITTDDYKNLGKDTTTKALISNALILSLRPGINTIAKAGGLHKFMNFPGIIFTDCGGFQMSRSIYDTKSKKGIHFRNPYDNSKVVLTPKKIIEIELTIGSDVAMMLDDMSCWGATKEEAILAMENTHRWGEESLKQHRQLKQNHQHAKQLLFGIVQGNFYPDLREQSAKFINSLEFDGIAIGGVAIGEPKEDMYRAVDAALPHITKDKPRYVMGVGSPEELLELINRGIDCFDSVYPSQVARHHTLFTKNGKISIDRKEYVNDFTPIDLDCQCHTCQNYTKAYLYHLCNVQEPIVKRLKSIHNLYFVQKLLEDAREAIKKKEFNQFKEDFIKRWKQ